MRWIGLLTFTSILMGNTMAFGETITFAREVAPIIYSQCVSCHRDGEVGPFPLLTYEQVKKQSEQIAAVVEQRIMPPWKAKSGHGRFLDERRLSDEEVAFVDDARHVTEEEGQQQGADVGAVEVGVGHQQHPVVAQLGDVEMLAEADPDSLRDLATAVAADGMARQRALVLQRLRRVGVDVIEAPWQAVGYRLIDRYLAAKQAEAVG